MTGPATEHLDALKADVTSARVVVFASRITDVREILLRFEELGIDHRLVTMAMGDASQRDRFHVLEEWTGSGTLPQVFIDGHFIGGPKELFAHRAMQGQRPAAGAWLGYLGLIPFAVALAGVLLTDGSTADYFAHQFVAYGAVILSFVGAVHWGVALGGGPAPARRMVVSVLPALAAWAALLLPPPNGAWLLIIGFLALRAWEATGGASRGLPAWYLHLRTRLTAGVTLLALAFALAAS
jgi:glutaredoxin